MLISKLDPAAGIIQPKGPRQPENTNQETGWTPFSVEIKKQTERLSYRAGDGPIAGTSGPSSAGAKLSELLMAQALRTILPKEPGSESSTASETWRGMLADVVAEKVAEAMPAIVPIK